ncbi:MAG: leucyl/phenylalanyl-tRNA--protein transferase [Syntrophales bacterium]|nr:leucyl/phenylalanyl-tRNA--protein transferase [Syntrophales bacterium]
MPVFFLNSPQLFPPPEFSLPNGLLAIGGDLSPESLLSAYRMGIFPWFSEGEPILWWSPDPRFIILPDWLHIPRSLRQFLKKRKLTCTFDFSFADVIAGCQAPRKGGDGTWITREMAEAYLTLHELGYAHSVEVWEDTELVGGLYGVSLGKCFFGESMFSKITNASKVAFVYLIEKLKEAGFILIDCQIYSHHLFILGARNVTRPVFLQYLKQAVDAPTHRGKWNKPGILL